MQWIKGNTIDNVPELMEKEEENEGLEFTINDDLLDFYRLSKDHKANRKYQKNEVEQLELIPGEQLRPNVQSISKLPPINRSKLRQLELEWLYGPTNSTKIHARETKIQMEFDEIFDKKTTIIFSKFTKSTSIKSTFIWTTFFFFTYFYIGYNFLGSLSFFVLFI